ncbi:PXN1 [Auxenochlorella protothecoides x Auxenochlorella symbiontica]
MTEALVEGVSGALGGCVATIATYPLSTVAILQATTVRNKPQEAGHTPFATPLSSAAQFQQILGSQGWKGLFRGLEAALVGTTVSQGVYFTLYSLLRGAATGDIPGVTLTVPQSLAVASLAGAGNVLLTNPIWVVATRMQAHRRAVRGGKTSDGDVIDPEVPPRASALSVIREVFHEYGVPGFWNGCQASLVMVINPTLQYTLYEWLAGVRAKLRAQQTGKVTRASALEVFILSALAKAGATVVTYPMLTVKTRMMTARRGDTDMQYSSVGDAVAKIWQTEGVPGYYQGLRPKLVQSVLAAALLFMAKEEITAATRRLLLARPVRATS